MYTALFFIIGISFTLYLFFVGARQGLGGLVLSILIYSVPVSYAMRYLADKIKMNEIVPISTSENNSISTKGNLKTNIPSGGENSQMSAKPLPSPREP